MASYQQKNYRIHLKLTYIVMHKENLHIMSNLMVKNFYGEIAGRNIYSFLAKLDYDLKTSTERVEHLKKVLSDDKGNVHPFFERIFEQTHDEKTKLNTSYIKLILNTTDGLYSDTNVCEVITKLTDYVLFAEDMRELDRANKTEYKIYKDEVLFRKAQREISLEGEVERQGATIDGDTTIDDVVAKLQGEHEAGYDKFKSHDDVVHILVKDTNFKKSTNQVIYSRDYDDAEIGELLKAYQYEINKMNERLQYNKSRIPLLEAVIDSKSTDTGFSILLGVAGVSSKEEATQVKIELVRDNKMLMKQIGLMKCDMIDVKELIKKPIRFKHLMNGSAVPDLSDIDFIPKHMEDAVLWLRQRAKEFEEYYSGILDDLEREKRKGEQVVKKIQKYNKLYIEAQLMQTMSDKELYGKYIDGIIEVIKQLIIQPDKEHYDFQDSLELEVYLAKEILKGVKMDELDTLILKLLQDGWKQKEVAFILNRDFKEVIDRCAQKRDDEDAEVDENGSFGQKSVSKRLRKIAKRVMKVAEKELDDYLDTFRPADKVKVCSKCGRTLSRTKFDTDNTKKDKLKSRCKECRKGE